MADSAVQGLGRQGRLHRGLVQKLAAAGESARRGINYREEDFVAAVPTNRRGAPDVIWNRGARLPGPQTGRAGPDGRARNHRTAGRHARATRSSWEVMQGKRASVNATTLRAAAEREGQVVAA